MQQTGSLNQIAGDKGVSIRPVLITFTRLMSREPEGKRDCSTVYTLLQISVSPSFRKVIGRIGQAHLGFWGLWMFLDEWRRSDKTTEEPDRIVLCACEESDQKGFQ